MKIIKNIINHSIKKWFLSIKQKIFIFAYERIIPFRYGICYEIEFPIKKEYRLGEITNFGGSLFHKNRTNHLKISKLLLHVGDNICECTFPLESVELKNTYPQYNHCLRTGFVAIAPIDSFGEIFVWIEIILKDGKTIKLNGRKHINILSVKNYLFSIELPSSWDTIIEKPIEFRGYCFTELWSLKKLIMHAGEDSFYCDTKIERKDIEDIFSQYPGSKYCGFYVRAVFTTSGHKTVYFEACFENGEGEIINTNLIINVKGVIFKLEHPINRIISIGECVTFAGWCFHDREAISKVIMYADDLSCECRYHLERSEIKDQNETCKYSSHSGFIVYVYFYYPGERRIWFDIYLKNGNIETVNCGSIWVDKNDIHLLSCTLRDYFMSGDDEKEINIPEIKKRFGVKLSSADHLEISKEINNNIAFTIAKKSDLPFALTLAKSFISHNPDIKFTILFTDWIYDKREVKFFSELLEKEVNFIFWPEIKNKVQIDILERLFFKYNGIEMQTLILPFVFEYFIKSGYEKIIYIDYDIYCLGSILKIIQLLDNYDFILPDHQIMSKNKNHNKAKTNMLKNNKKRLKFIGLRASDNSIINCMNWREKTYDISTFGFPGEVYEDFEQIKYLPQQFSNTFNVKDLGYKLDSRLLNHENVQKINGKWYVEDNEMVLIQFNNGYWKDNERINKNQNKIKLHNLPVSYQLIEEYNKKISENLFETYKDLKYYFDFLPKTDIKLPEFVRKFFYIDVFCDVPMPFRGDEVSVKKLLRLFTEDEYTDGIISKISRFIWFIRPDLQAIFPNLNKKHIRNDFKKWFVRSSTIEYGLDKRLQKVNTKNEITLKYRSDALGINIISYFSQIFGIAESARAFVKSLYSSGIPFSIFNVTTKLHQYLEIEEYQEFTPYLSEKPLFDVNMFFINADELTHITKVRIPYLFKGKYNIGVFWWEFEDYFQDFKEVFDHIDHVVVFSDFIVRAIKKAAPASMRVTKLPFPFIENWKIINTPSKIRKTYHLDDDDFVFMFHFDFLSTIERKNPEGALKAFSFAFRRKKKIKFLIKTLHSEKCQNKVDHLLEVINKYGIKDNIILIHHALSRDELMSLINAIDCYVSLHRSEGLGLGMMEAMYLGKPVIATGYGGNGEFMNNENSILVNYSMETLNNDVPPYKKGFYWADPNIEEAAAHMKRIYEDKKYACKLGKMAEESIKKHFNQKNFTKTIYSFLETL